MEGDPRASAVASLDALFDPMRDLASGDPQRIAAALEAGGYDPRLLPHVLPLLGRFEELAAVVAWLRQVAPRSVGTLLDALLEFD